MGSGAVLAGAAPRQISDELPKATVASSILKSDGRGHVPGRATPAAIRPATT